jgi:hypothetical protein
LCTTRVCVRVKNKYDIFFLLLVEIKIHIIIIMHTCFFQWSFKFVCLVLLLIWIVIEIKMYKKSYKYINSFSRHIVVSNRKIRALYALLITCSIFIFILGYIYIPYNNTSFAQKACLIFIIVMYSIFFIDLFCMYKPHDDIQTQFKKYHIHIFLSIIIIMFFILSFSPWLFNRLHIHQIWDSLSYKILNVIILLLLFVLCIVFRKFFYTEDIYVKWYGHWELVVLLFIIILFPTFCIRCRCPSRTRSRSRRRT